MDLSYHIENISKHGVTVDDVDECFADPQRIVRRIGAIYWLVGKTEAGRLLQIGFRKRTDKTFFVFHAMAANQSERRQYKSKGK